MANKYYLKTAKGEWMETNKRHYEDMWYVLHKEENILKYGDMSKSFRIVRGQNQPNRAKNHNSLYKGVSKHGKRFQARFEGKSCGYYDQRDDAARAYDEAAKKKYGSGAVLNFPIDT